MTINQNLRSLGPLFVGLVVDYVQPQPVRPAEIETARRWHVVQVRPHGEVAISEDIEKGGVGVYVPREHSRIAQRTMKGRRWRDVERPMFSGYVFASFDPAGDRWKSIAGVEGVVRLLMCEGQPMSIAEYAMMRIRHIEAELAEDGGRRRKVSGLRLNSIVQITEGPFEGFIGPIIAIDRKARTVTVEAEVFGRKVPITLPPENVVVVDWL